MGVFYQPECFLDELVFILIARINGIENGNCGTLKPHFNQ
jgi:hypothetical protein